MVSLIENMKVATEAVVVPSEQLEFSTPLMELRKESSNWSHTLYM